MKPAEYNESRIVTEDTPYHVEDLKGTHSDPGMLHLGRVVWAKKSPEGQTPEQRVSVYAEELGSFHWNHASFGLIASTPRCPPASAILLGSRPAAPD